MNNDQPTVGLTQWDEPTVSEGPASPAPDPDDTGSRLVAERYLVLEQVGEGGMGVVYSAWDTRLDRRVALKMVRPNRVRKDTAQRLHREAQAMARLNHHNVAVVHDAGEHDGRPYVAMEYVAGQDLESWLKAEVRPWRNVLTMFLEAGRGLAAAHAAGIVHRDFKPSTVLIGDDGRVRVTDFGIARATGTGSTETEAVVEATRRTDSGAFADPLTREGVILGTPAYMAPEQVLEGRADPRSDQFAFCVALYQALYDTHPFPGVMPGPDMAAAAAEGPPEKTPDSRTVPSWIFPILQRGLRAATDDRFADMESLCAALENDPDANRSRRKRRRLLAIGAVLAALAVLCIPFASWLETLRIQRVGQRASDEMIAAARSSRIMNRFQEVAGARGSTAASSVGTHLQTYAERWQSAWKECATDRRDDERSDPRLRCLSRRLRTAQTLVELLEAADPELVSEAESAVLDLQPPEGCVVLQADVARTPPPGDPDSALRISEVEALVDRADAMHLAGQFDARRTVLQAALADARETGWQPLVAAVLVGLGTAQSELSELATAEETLRQGLNAAERGLDDGEACRAAVQLAWVAGVQDSRFDDAELWRQLARAKLWRVGDDAELAAEVATVSAAVLRESGSYDEALGEQRRALKLVEQAFGPSSIQAARAWHASGMLAAERGEHSEAERAYRTALDLKTQLLAATNPGIATTLSSLAATLVAQGRAKEATVPAKRAVEIHEAALTPNPTELAKALTTFAVALEEGGDLDGALSAYSRALTETVTALGPDHLQVGYARINLAILQHSLGDTDKAVENAQDAARILAAELGEEHPHVAFAENNLGMLLHYAGRSDEAVPHLERSLGLRKRNGADALLVAQTQFNLGRAVFASGRVSAGLKEVRAAHHEAQKLGEKGAELCSSIDSWTAEHATISRAFAASS